MLHREEHLSLRSEWLPKRFEEGYRDALAAGGKAFILAEDHRWLRLLALGNCATLLQFWNKLEHLPPTPPNHQRMSARCWRVRFLRRGKNIY